MPRIKTPKLDITSDARKRLVDFGYISKKEKVKEVVNMIDNNQLLEVITFGNGFRLISVSRQSA